MSDTDLANLAGTVVVAALVVVLIFVMVKIFREAREDQPAGRRQTSTFIGGDVKDCVIIDCESDADVFIGGTVENLTMENVRHRPRGTSTAEVVANIEESKRSGALKAIADSGHTVAMLEHELGIKGHEDTCVHCHPVLGANSYNGFRLYPPKTDTGRS